MPDDPQEKMPHSQTIVVQQAPPRSTNVLGVVGFVLALIGTILGICIWPVAVLAVIGLILSFIGMFKEPRGLAIAGFIVGLLGSIIVLIMVFVIGAIGTGIVGGAITAANQAAVQVESATKARGIQQAAIVYANGNAGLGPDNIGVLLSENMFSADYILLPSSGIAVPPDLDSWDWSRKANWAAANASYIVLPNQKMTFDEGLISVFADPYLVSPDRVPVSYSDGSSATITRARLETALAEQNPGKTMEQIIEESRQWTSPDLP